MNRALVVLSVVAGTVAATETPSLAPAACGVRNTLWIEHYTAQLFVPADASIAAVGDASKPKMLTMRMLNTFLMPPEIPRKWREALQPVLDGDAMKRLQDGYDGLRDGDTVMVTYEPEQGIALRVNDRTLVTAKGHAAIDALLAAWADDAPVEQKLSGTASRNRCA
jgi:hypothetical protein